MCTWSSIFIGGVSGSCLWFKDANEQPDNWQNSKLVYLTFTMLAYVRLMYWYPLKCAPAGTTNDENTDLTN